MNSLKQFDKTFLTKKVKHLAWVDEAVRAGIVFKCPPGIRGCPWRAGVVYEQGLARRPLRDSRFQRGEFVGRVNYAWVDNH